MWSPANGTNAAVNRRDLMMRQRTQVINALRAYLAEAARTWRTPPAGGR